MTMTNDNDKAALTESSQSRDRRVGLFWCTVAYLVALAGAMAAGYLVRESHPLVIIAVADVVGTVLIFAFSVVFNNSSFYDPYWSVAPIVIAAFWLWIAPNQASLIRQILLTGAVALWAVRLTYNWARGWRGLQHEDWRYIDIRKATGKCYWLASFLTIHFFPTALVYAGCLGFYPALASSGRPFNVLDAAAFAVCLMAVWFEATADKQLHQFVSTRKDPDAVLDIGLWAYSRHPNYFGEVLFWWGVYLFGVSAKPDIWWIIAGPVAMTLLFFFISIPLIDKRMLRRRPHYREHMKRVSRLIPWFRART